MNYLRHFIIPFIGLKVGNHSFAFEIEDKFFDHFEYSEIKKGRLHVDCLLEKQVRMMILYFDINGTVRIPCDRCAEEFDQPIIGRQKLIVKFGADHVEESDEVLIINEKESELDTSQFLYEYVHLMLPFKKVHGKDENGNSLCNPEVIRYIIEKDEPPVDPRWDVLQKIKNQPNNKENK